MPVLVASRAWLVGVCSGSVLAAGGVLILVWRPSLGLAWVGGVVLGLSVATLLHPSLTFLALQSGMIGLLLTALLAVMHRLLGHRRAGAPVYGDVGGRAAGLASSGSALSRAAAVGSDDSTAIRARPVAPKSAAALAEAPGTEGDTTASRPGRIGLGGTSQ